MFICLLFREQTADELGGDHLGGAGEERLGERVWELLGGRGGYGSGACGSPSAEREDIKQINTYEISLSAKLELSQNLIKD